VSESAKLSFDDRARYQVELGNQGSRRSVVIYEYKCSESHIRLGVMARKIFGTLNKKVTGNVWKGLMSMCGLHFFVNRSAKSDQGSFLWL